MDEETTCPEINISQDILKWIIIMEENYKEQKAKIIKEVMERLSESPAKTI
jgi:hypothetical protein